MGRKINTSETITVDRRRWRCSDALLTRLHNGEKMTKYTTRPVRRTMTNNSRDTNATKNFK